MVRCGKGSGAHLVTVRIEKGFKVNDVGMGDESHDLQFTVLRVEEKID